MTAFDKAIEKEEVESESETEEGEKEKEEEDELKEEDEVCIQSWQMLVILRVKKISSKSDILFWNYNPLIAIDAWILAPDKEVCSQGEGVPCGRYHHHKGTSTPHPRILPPPPTCWKAGGRPSTEKPSCCQISDRLDVSLGWLKRFLQ